MRDGTEREAFRLTAYYTPRANECAEVKVKGNEHVLEVYDRAHGVHERDAGEDE